MNTPLLNILLDTTYGTAHWVGRNITIDVPWSENYFWGLTCLSILVWGLEVLFPWRKNQPTFRKDFWLDACYMYFNFFIFSIIISGVYAVLAYGFESINIKITSLALINISHWPLALQLLLFFVVLDFVQWLTHLSLHRINFLWRFHQVHHSIKEMGFAGHLRYHWMENIFYKPMKTLAVMLIGGFEPQQAFIVHFLTICIGHLNHANIKLSYGPCKYWLNNPVMHLYHHAYHLPKEHKYGVNFGITLSTWDYLFGSAYIPEDSGNIKLGYAGEENMPQTFLKQLIHGFAKPKR
jgi:sterol desaturase/sphingolipid hydroxylase (fatty acid hydroxylase superfamily)